MFDIDDLESLKSKTFDLIVGHRDPVGDAEVGDPVGFRVLSASSDEFRNACRAHDIAAVKLAAKRGAPIDPKTDDGAEAAVMSGELRRDMIVAECVVGWFGFTIGHTEPFPFSKENLERVLRAKPEWRDDIYNAINKEANFMTG